MPIRPDSRWLYPIDWPQLSDTIRSVLARAANGARPASALRLAYRDGR
jgi:hypothetical protein